MTNYANPGSDKSTSQALEAPRRAEDVYQQHSSDLSKQNESLKLSNEKLQHEVSWLKEALKLCEEQARKMSSKPRQNPTIGSFSTTEIRTSAQPRAKTMKSISFRTPYTIPPHVALGITVMDISNESDVRMSAFASDVSTKGFNINVDGAPCTEIHCGGCSWLEFEADDPDFQMGRVSTLDYHPWNTYQGTNKRHVTFSRPYDSPPQVVSWITAFDMGRERSWRLSVYTSDVTKTGFTIHMNTWGDTILVSAIATWVAYPAGKKGVSSGGFSATDVRPISTPQPYNSGYSMFKRGAFTATPRVFTAINMLDIDSNAYMRLEVKTSQLSPVGMMWQLNSWRDTKLYMASAAYIAFE